MGWIDAFHVVATVLSLGGAAYAWWYANKSQKAREAAAEARRFAEEARRQSEQQLAETRRLADEAASQTSALAEIARCIRLQLNGPTWSVRKVGDYSFSLVNLSPDVLRGVDVALDPVCDIFSAPGLPCDVGGFSERKFYFEPVLSAPSDPDVVVSWIGVSGESREWRCPLPLVLGDL